jgi:molecular chaperone DnaK (HSP70)
LTLVFIAFECSISRFQVPSYFSQKERRAMLDAAELGGLNVLGLINENTAGSFTFVDEPVALF